MFKNLLLNLNKKNTLGDEVNGKIIDYIRNNNINNLNEDNVRELLQKFIDENHCDKFKVVNLTEITFYKGYKGLSVVGKLDMGSKTPLEFSERNLYVSIEDLTRV